MGATPVAQLPPGAPALSPARRLVVVTGKGGVGKTTIATALALASAAHGRPTVIVETGGRDDVLRALAGTADEPRARRGRRRTPGLPEGLEHHALDAPHALREYLRGHLPRGAAPFLLAGGAFETLAAATPGLAELLTIGQAWELTRPDASGGRKLPLVILDAPSSGHALALLRAPRTFAQAVRTGPVRAQARRIDAFLRNPAQTAVVAVSTAEQLAVAETLFLQDELHRTLGTDLHTVVVNALLPSRFSAAEVGVLRACRPSRWRRAALASAERSRHQHLELGRLRDGLGDVPVVTVPFMLHPLRGAAALRPLAAALGGG